MKKYIPELILFFYSSLAGQVQVEKVNIDAEFYGALNKTRAEFFVTNTVWRDSLSATIRLKISRSSIVTDMWLEIGGELKRAETLSSTTGEHIYNRITRRRIDPALMLKEGNGEYTIRVYPVNSNQKRRLVIEYYSILESDQSDGPVWLFDLGNERQARSDAFKPNIDLTVSGKQPENTVLYFNKRQYRVETEINLQSNIRNDKVTIKFDYLRSRGPIVIHNESTQLVQYNTYTPFKYVSIGAEANIPEDIRYLIDLFRYKHSVHVITNSRDLFLTGFLEYCIKKYNLDVMFHHEAWNWYATKRDLVYKDAQFSLVFDNKVPSDPYVKTIGCPFAGVFDDYLSILNKTIKEQKEHGFLTYNTSKLMIENDERAVAIRNDELNHEVFREKFYGEPDGFSFSNSAPPLLPLPAIVSTPDVLFVSFEEAPEPIGGWRALRKNVMYPGSIDLHEIKGVVRVNCHLDTSGAVLDTRILESVHPLLDFLAMYAVRKTKWKPAMQRETPVEAWFAVPVRFDPDRSVRTNGHPLGIGDQFTIDFEDRTYRVEVVENNYVMYDQVFNGADCREIGVLTDDFFALLVEYPDLVTPIWKVFHCNPAKEVGVIAGDHSILITGE